MNKLFDYLLGAAALATGPMGPLVAQGPTRKKSSSYEGTLTPKQRQRRRARRRLQKASRQANRR